MFGAWPKYSQSLAQFDRKVNYVSWKREYLQTTAAGMQIFYFRSNTLYVVNDLIEAFIEQNDVQYLGRTQFVCSL